jgi:hypothetical protein
VRVEDVEVLAVITVGHAVQGEQIEWQRDVQIVHELCARRFVQRTSSTPRISSRRTKYSRNRRPASSGPTCERRIRRTLLLVPRLTGWDIGL